MPKVYELMPAFQQEIEKLALSPAMHSTVGALGAGGGVGMLLGGLGGAALGGYAKYRDARNQGGSVRDSALSGVGGALGGAAAGAGLGTVLGATGLAQAVRKGSVDPGAVGRLVSKENMLGSFARAGQRQVHAFTGWTPEAGIRSIRGGAYTAEKRLEDARKLTGPGAEKAVGRAGKAYAAAEKAEKMNINNIPGYVKALATPGDKGFLRNAKDVIGTGAAEQWHGGGAAHKALTFGLPAASLVSTATSKSQDGGPGKAERVGGALGSLVPGIMPLSIGGQAMAGIALGAAGGRAGRLLDRRPKQAPPAQTGPEDVGAAVQHEASDRASGQIGGV